MRNQSKQVDKNVGCKLRALRETCGQSEGQLAEAGGVSDHDYRQAEQGERRPTPTELLRYAAHFGVSITEFFATEDAATLRSRDATLAS